ncbi:putative D-lactate dehydrogenase [Seiridium cardinale]
MKLAIFSTKPYDKLYLTTEHAAELDQAAGIEVVYHDFPLTSDTAELAKGADAVCIFVNDNADASIIESLAEHGVKAILLRCAGFNNVDLEAAEKHGLFVANVPSYSPESVAEFALALIQTLNRNTHRAYNRVREGNFNLDGLLGRTLHGKTVGFIGTGKIGVALARIMNGCGCKIIGFDPFQNDDFMKLGEYMDLDALLPQCDIVSLHCPLMDKTKHIINDDSLAKMKTGAILVNTSRGGLVNTKSVIAALKSKKLGGLALDVYDGEGALFYNDHSGHIIEDDELMRLTTFHNVIVCGHQAFFTAEALQEISNGTLKNLADFAHRRPCKNSLLRTKDDLLKRKSIPVRI